jgi:hypothetical protein
MLKKSLLFLLIAGLTACATNSKINNEYIPNYNYRGLTFNGINDTWGLAKHDNIYGIETNTYLLNTETEDVWSEKITTTHELVDPGTTVKQYYSQVIYPEVNDQCYYESPNSHILQQTNDNLVFAYTMKNCGKNADQTVVGRIIRVPNGICTITYSVKNNNLIEPQEDQMAALVNTAGVINN